MKNGQQPAFPRPYSRDEHSSDRPQNHDPQEGLTKREHFAAMALQGIMANDGMLALMQRASLNAEQMKELISKQSIEYADELLKQLEAA